jgi:hypothetical protein
VNPLYEQVARPRARSGKANRYIPLEVVQIIQVAQIRQEIRNKDDFPRSEGRRGPWINLPFEFKEVIKDPDGATRDKLTKAANTLLISDSAEGRDLMKVIDARDTEDCLKKLLCNKYEAIIRPDGNHFRVAKILKQIGPRDYPLVEPEPEPGLKERLREKLRLK